VWCCTSNLYAIISDPRQAPDRLVEGVRRQPCGKAAVSPSVEGILHEVPPNIFYELIDCQKIPHRCQLGIGGSRIWRSSRSGGRWRQRGDSAILARDGENLKNNLKIAD
jgi:hypothetical protein